ASLVTQPVTAPLICLSVVKLLLPLRSMSMARTSLPAPTLWLLSLQTPHMQHLSLITEAKVISLPPPQVRSVDSLSPKTVTSVSAPLCRPLYFMLSDHQYRF